MGTTSINFYTISKDVNMSFSLKGPNKIRIVATNHVKWYRVLTSIFAMHFMRHATKLGHFVCQIMKQVAQHIFVLFLIN